jgi:hypothetical protein
VVSSSASGIGGNIEGGRRFALVARKPWVSGGPAPADTCPDAPKPAGLILAGYLHMRSFVRARPSPQLVRVQESDRREVCTWHNPALTHRA